ncbi:hypothetical protein N665_0363s0001 [Sinapis alba]|nr:hypothetical protein N665_0363s0001 [Sinapis alba]
MVNVNLMLSLPSYLFFQSITNLLKKEVSGLLAVNECILIVLVLSYF